MSAGHAGSQYVQGVRVVQGVSDMIGSQFRDLFVQQSRFVQSNVVHVPPPLHSVSGTVLVFQ